VSFTAAVYVDAFRCDTGVAVYNTIAVVNVPRARVHVYISSTMDTVLS